MECLRNVVFAVEFMPVATGLSFLFLQRVRTDQSLLDIHYDNMPMQYTVIFTAIKTIMSS